jgi:hypothetical protein
MAHARLDEDETYMNTLKCWRVDPRIVPLGEIFDWCYSQKADRVLSTIRYSQGPDKGHNEPVSVRNNIRDIFGESIEEEFWATAWPGTELIGHSEEFLLPNLDLTSAVKC